MKRRALLPAIALLTLAAACGESDPSVSETLPAPETTAQEPAATTVQTDPDTTAPASSDPEPVDTAPVDTVPAETDPVDTAPATSDLPDVIPPDERPGADVPAVVGEVPDELLKPVLVDAAARAGVTTDEVEVRRAESVLWNDGSLGCGEPGEISTQAIVDGFWVEIVADGTPFDYRLDGQGSFRICERSTDAGTTEPPTT